MTINLYGIKTCGSVKKAITLLEKHEIPFIFIDLKQTSPSAKLIASWIDKKGIKIVLNTKGTTYKRLKSEGKIQDSMIIESKNAQKAQAEFLSQNPMLLKRPVIAYDKGLIIGYDESEILGLIHEYQSEKY